MIERLKIDFAIPPHRVVLRAIQEFEAALEIHAGEPTCLSTLRQATVFEPEIGAELIRLVQ